MSILPDYESSWYLLPLLLEWVKLLAATHIGYRFVRAYASRSRREPTQLALQQRVQELEQTTEALSANLQQVLDAERFAVALLLQRAPEDATRARASVSPPRVTRASTVPRR